MPDEAREPWPCVTLPFKRFLKRKFEMVNGGKVLGCNIIRTNQPLPHPIGCFIRSSSHNSEASPALVEPDTEWTPLCLLAS
jgi:hypothetical protein